MGNSFDTRLNAGQQLLKLFADLGENPLTPAPLETISTVLKEIWSWSNSGTPNEIVLGFFSQHRVRLSNGF